MYRYEINHGGQRGKLKIVEATLLVGQQIGTPMLAINPERYPYQAPYVIVTNGQNRENHERSCPENSPFVVLNAPGVGDVMMGVYASNQIEEIMADEPGGKEVCYLGFVYGSEYDVEKNTDALREFILKEKPKRVIIFATSFGGIAMIDVLNEYHRRYPEDETEFALVMMSTPGEADDLQIFSRMSAEALSRTPIGKGLVYTWTLGSVMQHPGNNVLNGQTWIDSGTAAANTPPHTVEGETRDLIENGMDKLLVDIPVYLITDLQDEVVNGPRSVETIRRRLGQDVIVWCISHPDDEFQKHGTLWVVKYRQYYAPTIKKILGEINVKLNEAREAKERAKIAEQILLYRMGEKSGISSQLLGFKLGQMVLKGPVSVLAQQPSLVTVRRGR